LAVLHAVLRDVGMLAATIRCNGVEPTIALPELGPALVRLGIRTAHVPRDTILHYSVFNPSGERRRRFSDDRQEDSLIDAITVGADSVVAAIRALSGAARMDFASAEFLKRCNVAERNLSHFVSAMAGVARSVTPDFFAYKLRPHWEQMLVAGTQYDGPGPVQLPIYVVDQWAWAANCTDETYLAYADHNMSYTLEEFRRPFIEEREDCSLVSAYCRWSASPTEPPAVRRRAREALLGIMNCLVRFRRIHRAFAFRAYDIRRSRDPEAVGSSGYGPEVLQVILRLTEHARTELLASDPMSHLPMK
jgi:hypothetical protein